METTTVLHCLEQLEFLRHIDSRSLVLGCSSPQQQPQQPQQAAQQQQPPSSENGSVHLKILIPSIAAGAIIGKGGETIAELQKQAGARVKMSKANDFYPGKEKT